jgi:ribosomal-protein-alanine N-acetyltransferase
VLPILKGKIICLRAVTQDDVGERYLKWMNDREVTQYLEVRFSHQSLENITDFVRKMSAKQDEFLFAICVINANGAQEHIGNIKLGPINPHHKSADVSLVIGEKSAHGKGYGTEAICLITQYGFEVLKLNKLKAGCYAPNEGSSRAFEKCGWQREGLLRSQVISAEGEVTDVVLLGITSSDYSKLGKG